MAAELVRNERKIKPAIRKRKTRAHKVFSSNQIILQARITNLLGGDVDMSVMNTSAGQQAFVATLAAQTDESSPYVQAIKLIHKARTRAHLKVV